MSDTGKENSKPKQEASHEVESELAKLKMEKSRKKANFTRFLNRLLTMCIEDSSDEELKETLDKVEGAMDECTEVIQKMVSVLDKAQMTKEMGKTVSEIDIIETKYEEALVEYRKAIADSQSESSSQHEKDTPETKTVDNDMYKQLKRVSIPVFKGRKKDYEFWKSAFYACVDSTKSSDEYKFLQLRQYLEGEALKCIEGLGHSAAAYKAAKERLERKYGGTRRKINRFMEEIDRFPPMKSENPKQIESFSDLLDITIINLKENDHEDLRGNFMYLQLLKKLPESMITRYIRWTKLHEKSETIEVLKDWIVEEAEYLAIARETKSGFEDKNDNSASGHRVKSYFANENKKSNRNCKLCKRDHPIWNCPEFNQMNVQNRWQKSKELALCFRCLRDNHQGRNCRKFRKCGINGCTKVHNMLLHKEESEINPNAAEFVPSANQQQTFYNSRSQIALRTVPVRIKSKHKEIKINALLDDGSTKTYINRDLAMELGLKGQIEHVKVNLLNGSTENFETMAVSLQLESLNQQTKTEIEAFVIENVTGSLETVNWNEHSTKWDHLKNIKFPTLGKQKKVDMLIGLDYPNLHRCIEEIHGHPGEPIARLTPLGWTCVGQIETDNYMASNFFIDLNQAVKGFWEIDNYPTSKNDNLPMSKHDLNVLRNTENKMKYSSDYYEVQIPWKTTPELPDNYEIAAKRLEHTNRKLSKDPDIAFRYGEVMDSYEKKGYLRKVPEKEIGETKWYLPHFPVVKMQRETTKVRIVFDAAAKCKGVCLNDYIETGPKLQNELFDVLLRFRKHEIAIACDISEMYLKVGICETDRKYHRILWNDSVYEFTRLTFGVNASPFLAQLVAQTNARKNEDKFPAAAETVLKSTYMDDSMDSVKNEKQGIELYHDLSELWSKAGMYARKWMSNSVTVLEQIPVEDRAAEINLETGYIPNTKALGVNWRADTDLFSFSLQPVTIPEKMTKRYLLKKVASMFDPLGFIAPYVITGKILIQKLWLKNYDWDDEIDCFLKNEILNWVSDLQKLNSVTVPRCLLFKDNQTSMLHTFVDASEDAYSAVTYVQHTNNEQEITVAFVCSKTRVAPLTSTSIPRLELMAAVLGLRLALAVKKTLNLQENQMIFWSDSANVLFWITGHSRKYKPFIANRVGEIQENSLPSNWHHVPGEMNPADIATRGVSADQLLISTLWWQGPDFLYNTSEYWPKQLISTDISTKDVELKKKYVDNNSYIAVNEVQISDQLSPDRFSNWTRMIRVFAWVNRFITNCRSKSRTKQKVLTSDELADSENSYIVLSQKEMYPEEYRALKSGNPLPKNSKLLPLNVKLDSEGIIRCDTRLKYAQFLPYDTKYPIVLPRKHRVTKLIVKYYHEQCEHHGTNQTLAALSTRFWLISGREEIREYERECKRCRKMKAQASSQIMAPLPQARTEKTLRAFAYCSVDFGGPFYTKQGRGKSRQKRYLCLFTCLSSRAVHLELAMNMDTDSFLNAFYRMTCRRGTPIKMYSDNGTNFIGAYRELKELYEQMDKNKIVSKTSNRKIEWHFNPPAAPHFGGVHEIMIKSAKRAVYAILKGADVTDEELQTAFLGAEQLINSRPLSYQSAHPNDNTVLTPNHFLYGQIGGDFAPESVDETVFDVRKRWRRVQEIIKHVWKRWLRELLPAIGSRSKWFQEQPNLSKGDVVLVVDTDQPRGRWRLGRIVETFPGQDGRVRVVNVIIGGSIFKRPVTRLCLIEKCT